MEYEPSPIPVPHPHPPDQLHLDQLRLCLDYQALSHHLPHHRPLRRWLASLHHLRYPSLLPSNPSTSPSRPVSSVSSPLSHGANTLRWYWPDRPALRPHPLLHVPPSAHHQGGLQRPQDQDRRGGRAPHERWFRVHQQEDQEVPLLFILSPLFHSSSSSSSLSPSSSIPPDSC